MFPITLSVKTLQLRRETSAKTTLANPRMLPGNTCWAFNNLGEGEKSYPEEEGKEIGLRRRRGMH